METIFRVCLLVAGIVNLLPGALTFLPGKIASAYGIDVPNANYELLLRHRAALFLLVGGLLVFSATIRKYYELATFVGLFSMVSFVVLYLLIGKINPELKKVMRIDVMATLVLLVGYLLYTIASKKSGV